MAFRRRRDRISRIGDGRFAVDLTKPERETLGHLLPQLRQLLTEADSKDERIRRLFPTVYTTDPEKEAEYQHYMRSELMESKLAGLDLFEASLSRSELSEAELMGWMQSINSVRLVLGTLLDVSEDQIDYDLDGPDADGHLLYNYLSGLLDEIVTALSA
jgi:Domain of unknown function (DUF2017)